MEAAAAYSPVYHFTDDRLFERFIESIPHARLVAPLRTSETLRNRYFRGFRISAASPARDKIMAAYKREIVDRRNSDLAYSLCAEWVAENEVLPSVALKSLEIRTGDPGDAKSWINHIHSKLSDERSMHILRPLVRTLASQFQLDDVRIFVSIISYGIDQSVLRTAVEEEIANLTNTSTITKEQLEKKIKAGSNRLEELTNVRNEVEAAVERDLALAREALDADLKLHSELANIVRDHGAISESLLSQMEAVKSKLDENQRAKAAVQDQSVKLSETIEHRHAEINRLQTTSEMRINEIDRSLEEQTRLLAELSMHLRMAEERIAAEAQEKTGDQILAGHSLQSEPSLKPEIAGSSMNPGNTVGRTEILDNNAICYLGIQRVFRNAVVTFIRARMVRLFPDDHIQRVKKGFKDWDKAAQNAAESRENQGTRTSVRDEYDLLGTNHFYNIFENFYDRIFSLEAGQPPNFPKPIKARFMGYLKTIKDGRDPLSHPVEEEISPDEAQHLLYCAQEILKWLGCGSQSAELSELIRKLSGTLETSPLIRRVPSEDSIYLEFVGRNVLLKDLAGCFANADNKRCLLAGDGGKGKSAAAYKFIQTIPSSARFQLIVWLSAKKRKFREGEATSVESPDFSNSTEAIDRLLTEYGATAHDMDKNAVEKKRLLFEYLDQLPAFIVADDIDTLLDDEEVVSLFTYEIPHTQSAVLLTSRRAIPGIRTLNVRGFEPEEAEEFIKSRIHLYSLRESSFSSTIIREITKVSDGSPLYMDDLLRLAKVLDIHKAIKTWAEKGGDEARKYALQKEIEHLSADAKKVLIAAAVTDAPISFAELENILEFSEDRLIAALSELQTLFLFPKAPLVEGEQRYEINLNTKKLVRLVEGANESYARIDHRSKALASELPVLGHVEVRSLIRQALLRLNAHQEAEAENILLGAIEKFPAAPDLHGFLGQVYRRLRRIGDARSQFETAFKLKAKNSEMYLNWIRLEIAEKEWTKALAVADKALHFFPSGYEIIERKAFLLKQAGFDLHQRMHSEKAQKRWVEAVDHIKQHIKAPEFLPTGARKLNASMYYTMVVCLDMLNCLNERNRWLDQWESEHPDDPVVDEQKEFLIKKRGTLAAYKY